MISQERMDWIVTEICTWIYYHIPRLYFSELNHYTFFAILAWLRLEKIKNPDHKLTNLELQKKLWPDLNSRTYYQRIKVLIDRGYVEEGKRSQEDKRTPEIMITKKGLKALSEAEGPRKKFISDVLNSMQEKEVNTFIAIAERIDREMHKRIQANFKVD